jgi:peptidoglycan-associated lipoprotein
MSKSVVEYLVLSLFVVIGFFVLSGCPKKVETAKQSVGVQEGRAGTPPTEEVPPMQVPKIQEAEVSEGAGPVKTVLQDAFFDFDKAVVRDDAKTVLQDNAKWLRSNPKAKIQIEGHCDERGTNEYNLALGERRAQAAKRFLVALGIEANRISTISYGEERPFCMGSGEACYQQNRRAHFVMK